MTTPLFDKKTLEKFIKEILSSTGASFKAEEENTLTEQLRKQLSTAISISLINALDESAQKEFANLAKIAKNPEELTVYFKLKLNNPEKIAMAALTRFKEDFTQTNLAKTKST